MNKLAIAVLTFFILVGCRNDVYTVLEKQNVKGRHYVVVIGASISEGAPHLHGRLHSNEVGAFDTNHRSSEGQLNYEFSRIFDIPFINHGISGQTSTFVKKRWIRDVLGGDAVVEDGRGSKTIDFTSEPPLAVFLHVGRNDVVSRNSIEIMKDNYRFFAQSSLENDMFLIVNNLGADSSFGPYEESIAKLFNEWLYNDFITEFPSVLIIDYLGWSSDGTGIFTHTKKGMFADNVHPNEQGVKDYVSFAEPTIREEFVRRGYIDSNEY